MPTVTMFRRRHAQIQAALETYERAGRAPGIGQGQSLADSSYLGSFADHIQWWSISRYVVNLVTYHIHHPK